MNKPWVWVLMGCTTAIICTVLVIVAINWDRITYEETQTCYNPDAVMDEYGLPVDPNEPQWITIPADEPCP